MNSQNTLILKRYLSQNPSMQGIVLSDRDGVEILSSFNQPDNPIKAKQISIMYVASLTSCNDHLQRLSNTQIQKFTLVYDDYMVYIENWQNIILAIYLNPNSNIPALKSIANELREIFNKYNDSVQKIMKLVLLSALIYVGFAHETHESHWRIFGQSFSSIVVSEIGDKTFFLAAIMSMKYNRVAVYIGAISALVLMTAISCAFGMVVPQLIKPFYTELLVTIIFYIFAAKLLYEWHHMDAAEGGQELNEVESELQNLDKKLMNLPDQETDQVHDHVQTSFVQVSFQSILWQAFILTFLGEWGDRSQISTIGLAAVQDADIVCIGASIGHVLCSTLAVIGGKLLANRISERTVNLSGGLLFLLFALIHTYELIIYN